MRKPRLCKAFDPDPGIPEDHRRRRTCRNCRRVGEPGDPGHPPARPARRPVSPVLLAAGRARDAAILGETDRED